jgi:hypothetical protein
MQSVRIVDFHVNCSCNLLRMSALNLIFFRTFFLLFFAIIVQYLRICVQLHPRVHLATGPALLSLSISKVN